MVSDTGPKDDSNNEDDGILNAFTTTINPTKGIVEDVDEEEELVDFKFEKMDEQDDIHIAYVKLYKVSEKYEKLHRLATKKLSEVEPELEEISTKFDEANQTIGALRFENNFLAKKTKNLEVELFQVRAQLERTSSANLDVMLNLWKSTSDRTDLGYDFSSPSIGSTSITVFVPPTNNVETKNHDVFKFSCHMFMHFNAYVLSCFYLLILNLFGAFLIVCLSVSLTLVAPWHLNVNPLRPETLFIPGYLFLLLLIPLHLSYNSVMRRPNRTSWRTFHNKAFIRNAKSICQIFLTLTYPLSSTVEVGSHCVASRSCTLP